jgi:hypothetical protein
MIKSTYFCEEISFSICSLETKPRKFPRKTSYPVKKKITTSSIIMYHSDFRQFQVKSYNIHTLIICCESWTSNNPIGHPTAQQNKKVNKQKKSRDNKDGRERERERDSLTKKKSAI